NAWGSGFDPANDRVVVTGDGFQIGTEQVTATSITINLQVDPSMSPTIRSLRLVRTTTGDARVLSGAIEVRLPAPALSGISPATGGPGSSVTLKGANLRTGGVVIIGSEMVKSPSATGDTVVFACPSVPNGTYDVTFQNDDGQMAALTQGFTVSGSTVTQSSGGSSGSSSGSGSSGGSQQVQGTTSQGGASGGGGGGGGGGGCEVERSSRSPAALLPLLALLVIVARRRSARSV